MTVFQEIERIEDGLASQLVNDENAEELSRVIVERLDEITALREQSEIYLENEYIDDDSAADDDIPHFHHQGEVSQWYTEVSACTQDWWLSARGATGYLHSAEALNVQCVLSGLDSIIVNF